MKISNLYTLILIFVFTHSFQSCMKDKGNYEYNSVNRVAISGMKSFYNVDIGKRLSISPELSFSMDKEGDTSNYSYSWVANNLVGYTGAPRILSTKKDIDTTINLMCGMWSMYYRVTDKKTGVFTDWYFDLSVEAPAYEGWMLLCDTEGGNSRLDMVSHRGSGDTVYRDILDVVKSDYKTVGKPSFVATGFSSMGSPANGSLAIFVATSQKAVMLGLDSLDYKPSYDLITRFSTAELPQDWTDARMYHGAYAGMVYADKKIYRMISSSIISPVNTQDGGTAYFTPSKMIAYNGSQSVVFNEDTKTFLRYPGSGTTCLTLPDGTLFNFHINMDLLFMEYLPYNSGEVFAVLKNGNNGKLYLARFTIAGKQNYFGEITGEGIGSAEHFAVSPDLGYLFYVSENKIYEYDPLQKKSYLMLDYGNRDISMIRFQPFLSTYEGALNASYYTELSKKLLVCSYSQQDVLTSGKLDLYTVPDINGSLKLYNSHAGTGKIVSIAYRER